MPELHMRKMPDRSRSSDPSCWFRVWLKEERRTWAVVLAASLALLVLKLVAGA